MQLNITGIKQLQQAKVEYQIAVNRVSRMEPDMLNNYFLENAMGCGLCHYMQRKHANLQVNWYKFIGDFMNDQQLHPTEKQPFNYSKDKYADTTGIQRALLFRIKLIKQLLAYYTPSHIKQPVLN